MPELEIYHTHAHSECSQSPIWVMKSSVAPSCPVCLATTADLRLHKKDPTAFGVETSAGFSIFRCNSCHTEFAEPRLAMDYDDISEEYKTYERFRCREELEGRIHYTKRGTSDWKDSPIVYQILRQLNPEGTFLDFAAGSGYMTELARELGFRPLAVERSAEFRAFLQQNVPGINVYADLKEVRESDAKAVVALAMHVIEHLEDPVATLAELRAILRPEGMLIVVVPSLERSYYRFGEEGREMEEQIVLDGVAFDFPPHHLTRFTGYGMKVALERAGFGNVAVSYSLVGLWDLFHDGLGDETFRFASYFDKTQMPTIARIEKNLNEVLERLGLGNLGNCVIALASDGETSEELGIRLETARQRTLQVYQESVEEEFEQVQRARTEKEQACLARLEKLSQAIEEKDGYVESLRALLESKNGELYTQNEGLHSAQKALQWSANAMSDKDLYIDSLRQALERKDDDLHAYEEALQEAREALRRNGNAMADKDRYIDSLRQALEHKSEDLRAYEKALREAQWHLDLIPFRRALIRIGHLLKFRKGGD